MGSNQENSVKVPGPIRGIRYKYDQIIESIQFIYDACYCDFSITTPTTPVKVLMGDTFEVETSTAVSKLGSDIFDEDVDACLKATQIELSAPSEIFTVTDNFSGRIFTEDPD